jgi:hypothetical protein
MRTFVLAGILCFSALIASLHFLASAYSWYWQWPWFDILMHFLGGAFIGLASLWVLFHSRYVGSFHPSRKAMFAAALVGALSVGLGWEVFEYVAGATGVSGYESYALDTATDLAMDCLGAVVSYLLYSKFHGE